MMLLKDKCFKTPGLWQMLQQENSSQIQKWGVQEHTPFEWLTFTAEELGEMAKAIAEHHSRGGSAYNVVKEAIHTATLSLKIAEMYVYMDNTRQLKAESEDR